MKFIKTISVLFIFLSFSTFFSCVENQKDEVMSEVDATYPDMDSSYTDDEISLDSTSENNSLNKKF